MGGADSDVVDRSEERREPVRVEMHLDGGFTKVLLERTSGVGLADGGVFWDLPTERIPVELRMIGSRFVIVMGGERPAETDSAEEMRRKLAAFEVEPLPSQAGPEPGSQREPEPVATPASGSAPLSTPAPAPAPMAEAVLRPEDAAVELAWAALDGQWADDDAHRKFIGLCAAQGKLAEAGKRYRAIKLAAEDAKDSERAAVADKRLGSVLAAATALMLENRSVPVKRQNKMLFVAAGVIVALALWLLWAIVGQQ